MSTPGAAVAPPPPPSPYGAAPDGQPQPPAGQQQRKMVGAGGTSHLPRNVFIVAGIMLLILLCTVPVWNAVSLLGDSNYIFWMGKGIPLCMLVTCGVIVCVYALTIYSFFLYSRPAVQNEQTIIMIANVFITTLGLCLMVISMPLTSSSWLTYSNLMYHCQYSTQTHRVYEYWQVLHNIRMQPQCMQEFSVEDCDGYQDAHPYTTYLKSMESTFRCSGFCYQPDSGALAQASANITDFLQLGNSTHSAHTGRSLLAVKSKTRSEHDAQALHLEPVEGESVDTKYPPTLYSRANFQASCEGMAARHMWNFAGDIGYQCFYQGIYLTLIAVATGFLKLIGTCVRKGDHEREGLPVLAQAQT
mmetsp:Transcript_23022/g.42398  ORF Transcript_23022/g.42398 Transcript_23022/m.42398 type:complete len:359 (+) Transcript_23022:106-1182(+)